LAFKETVEARHATNTSTFTPIRVLEKTPTGMEMELYIMPKRVQLLGHLLHWIMLEVVPVQRLNEKCGRYTVFRKTLEHKAESMRIVANFAPNTLSSDWQ
jgi:hypothetical protein